MLRLENPEYLYLLFFVPVLIGIFVLMRFRRKAILKKYGEISLINRLFPDVSNYKPIVKLSIILFTYALLVIGIANPQLGTKLEESKREGIDVVIALDVSNSMNADDVKPSRLERAKQFVSNLTKIKNINL